MSLESATVYWNYIRAEYGFGFSSQSSLPLPHLSMASATADKVESKPGWENRK